MSDDVLARAKSACFHWEQTCGVTIDVWDGLVVAEDDYRNAPELVADLVTLAEAQAKRLTEIRVRCADFTPDPSLSDAILAILDGTPDDT